MKTKIMIIAVVAFMAAACPATTPIAPPPGVTIPIAYRVIQVDSIEVMIDYYTKMEAVYRSQCSTAYPETQKGTYFRGKTELCRQIIAELKEAKRDVYYAVLPITPPVMGPFPIN